MGEVHTPIQADGWEEQVAIQDHGWDEVADDEVELARALGTEISQDFELALEQPATIASMCARACNKNLTDLGERTRALQTGRPSTHQRTTSSVRQSESQSIGSRQTCCYMKRLENEKRKSQRHKPTDSHDTLCTCPNRFHNEDCHTVALRSSSSSVSAVVWSRSLRFLPLGTHGMLTPWCPFLKSAGLVISSSEQSLAIAHDFSIFVAPFRRGPRGVQQRKS